MNRNFKIGSVAALFLFGVFCPACASAPPEDADDVVNAEDEDEVVESSDELSKRPCYRPVVARWYEVRWKKAAFYGALSEQNACPVKTKTFSAGHRVWLNPEVSPTRACGRDYYRIRDNHGNVGYMRVGAICQ